MEKLTDLDFKKIIARRDPRYDGRFYFGVKTTKIYCRIVCPARPKPENIIIFKSQSEAENAGYRPCRRCYSDLAPGSKLLEGTSTTVSRALRLIENSNDELTVESLAEMLGMTDRHLRRLFDEHLGASPIDIILTKKLHLARRLVTETSTSLSEIALASGFHSIRRFNEAFKKIYQATPTELRGNKKTASTEIKLSLMLRPPFDWKNMMSFLDRHTSFGLELVQDNAYHRFIPTGRNAYGSVQVRLSPKQDALLLTLRDLPLSEVKKILLNVQNLFDVDHNPAHLPKSKLKPLGIRIPGAYDEFETAICIILGQLISTSQAKAKIKTLVMKYGVHIKDDVYAFPTPETLMHSEIEEIGITRVKANAIRELSQLYLTKEIDLSRGSDIEATRAKLLAIKGIGPWTVEMIAMRCLGDSDAYPKKDLIIERAIKLKLAQEQEWSSLRGYLTHILWRDYAVKLSKVTQKDKL